MFKSGQIVRMKNLEELKKSKYTETYGTKTYYYGIPETDVIRFAGKEVMIDCPSRMPNPVPSASIKSADGTKEYPYSWPFEFFVESNQLEFEF